MYDKLENLYGPHWNVYPPEASMPFMRKESMPIATPVPPIPYTTQYRAEMDAGDGEVLVVRKFALHAVAAVPNPYWLGTMMTRLPAEFFEGRIKWTPVVNKSIPSGIRFQEQNADAPIFSYGGGALLQTEGYDLLEDVKAKDGGPVIVVLPGQTFAIKINFGSALSGSTPPPGGHVMWLEALAWGYSLRTR